LPHNITRHTHPKARPETGEPVPPPATGIDYLNLTAQAHHEHVRGDQRIGFHALFGTNADTDDSDQVPGQLSLTDIIQNPTDDREATA
jgi:putative transposase